MNPDHRDPRKLSRAQRQALQRLERLGPQPPMGRASDGKVYTQPHRFLLLKGLARYIDANGDEITADEYYGPAGDLEKHPEPWTIEITQAGRVRLLIGADGAQVSKLCDQLAVLEVPEELLAPIRRWNDERANN